MYIDDINVFAIFFQMKDEKKKNKKKKQTKQKP